jgi:CDP-glycerol glycerophosphotransferase (TagB/SpsB family)
MAQYDDFNFNNVFQKNYKIPDYQTLFKESSLMVTDYSSVAMDFAYLYKPIIYTQFDKNEFFKQHAYVKGYFDYERDGFGPVVYDYKSTIDEIIKNLESNCILETEYKTRIDHFYQYHDKNNCKRVYEEILKLDM